MMRVIIVNSVKEFETKQQEIVDLLGINCRYSGRFESPDISLKNGNFAIPYPDKKEHQEQVDHLDWVEININDIIREEI